MGLSFYDNPDLADGFNIWPHPWRSQPHRGLDFANGTGTPIPSVNAGVVVISEWNPYLGNIVEVKGDDGVYMGYCHMNKPGLSVGSRVQVGDSVGPVGNTGSQSQGAHLHITKGDRQGAVRGVSLAYLSDPWPYIVAAKTLPALAEEEDEDMHVGMFRKVGSVYHVIIGNPSSGFKFKYTTGSGTYNNLKAEQFKTGSFTEEDQSVMDRFEEALDETRRGK